MPPDVIIPSWGFCLPVQSFIFCRSCPTRMSSPPQVQKFCRMGNKQTLAQFPLITFRRRGQLLQNIFKWIIKRHLDNCFCPVPITKRDRKYLVFLERWGSTWISHAEKVGLAQSDCQETQELFSPQFNVSSEKQFGRVLAMFIVFCNRKNVGTVGLDFHMHWPKLDVLIFSDKKMTYVPVSNMAYWMSQYIGLLWVYEWILAFSLAKCCSMTFNFREGMVGGRWRDNPLAVWCPAMTNQVTLEAYLRWTFITWKQICSSSLDQWTLNGSDIFNIMCVYCY